MSARRARRGRALDGVLAVDKPGGPTSFDVVRSVRRLTSAAKAGHAGTLDPMATGLLLVCLGEATKAVPWLMDAPKSYEARVRLGARTDTLDALGQVTTRGDVPPLERAALEETLARFRGTLLQVPPLHSALRRQGERLYELARRGEEVELEPRPVEVYSLTLRAIEPPDLVLTVTCGKGFYVRSLARDIGDALGCGGHLAALRRTATAGFSIDAATPLAALEAGERPWEDALLPVARALEHLPRVEVDAAGAEDVANGRPTAAPVALGLASDEFARVHGPDGRLLAIGQLVQLHDGRPALRVVRGFRGEAC